MLEFGRVPKTTQLFKPNSFHSRSPSRRTTTIMSGEGGFNEYGPSCLIFGATGFVGRHLVTHLIREKLCSRIKAVDKSPPELSWMNEEHKTAIRLVLGKRMATLWLLLNLHYSSPPACPPPPQCNVRPYLLIHPPSTIRTPIPHSPSILALLSLP